MASRSSILCYSVMVFVLLALVHHINGRAVVDSCGDLEFAPNNFIAIDETAQPGTHIFSIAVNNQETWSYKLDRSADIDGSLWRELQSYFNFKRFGNEYEMIVDKTPDLEYIYVKYSIMLKSLRFSMTCSSPGVPDQSTDLMLVIRPVNEYAPQFIGEPLQIRVLENTPIHTRVFSMENVTIDRDTNPSNKEISVFRLHKYLGEPQDQHISRLDSLAYFSMSDLQKGIITVRENLDFEALDAIGSTTFMLNVSAADVHNNVSYTTLHIDIDDVNDLPPEFLHPSCPLHIQRTRPCPVSFLARISPKFQGPMHDIIPAPIQARDMDAIGANITLSLDKGPGELSENTEHFAIDNKTGVVTVLSPFLAPIDVDLVVVAREESVLGRTTQAPFRVSVIVENSGASNPGVNRPETPSDDTHTNNNKTGDGTGIVTRSDDSIDGASNSGMDSNTIFLIIIGVLSSLVLILAVLSTFMLCSIKKDQKSKVVPAPIYPNNLLYSDRPSSYHRSLDGTSLDLTHDEFDMASEKNNVFVTTKSRSSVVSHNKQQPRRIGEHASVTRQSASGYGFDRSDSTADSKHYKHQRRDPSVLDNMHGRRKLPENAQTVSESQEYRNRQADVVYQDNLCCTSMSTGKLYKKQNIGRPLSTAIISKDYRQDRLAFHPKNNLRFKSSPVQQTEHEPRCVSISERADSPDTIASKDDPFSTSSKADIQTPLSTESTDINSLSSPSSQSTKKRRSPPESKTSSRSQQAADLEARLGSEESNSASEHRSEQSNVDTQHNNNRQSSSVTQRRIRIPSGVLVMTGPVSPADEDTSKDDNGNKNSVYDNYIDIYDDNDNDEHALVTDDELSSCFDSVTPNSTPAQYFFQSKHRVSFQLDNPQHDVLSMMPVEMSSSEETMNRSCPKMSADTRHMPEGNRDDNPDTPQNEKQNNGYVPNGSNASILLLQDPQAKENTLFEKVQHADEMDGASYSPDEIPNRHHVKPRRLPELIIPGRKSSSDTNPGPTQIPEVERPQSEILTRDCQIWDSGNALPDTERNLPIKMLSPSTIEQISPNAASSVIRKKKTKRRALSGMRE